LFFIEKDRAESKPPIEKLMEEGERSRGVAAYRTSGLKATSLDRLLVDHLLVELLLRAALLGFWPRRGPRAL
jgi:hypothetical protein